MQRYQREHFWNAIVWPLLWPLLLVQAALVVLCLMVGAMVWWMTPSHASWSTTLWLMSALLVGSSLNAGAFLMLVKARARRKDNRLSHELSELERHSQVLFQALYNGQFQEQFQGQFQALCQEPFQKLFPNAHDDSLMPCQRLASINEVLAHIEHCLQGAQGISAASKNTKHEHEQTLLDDLQHQQQQLKHLRAGRERAREESRLKTGYLTLLQRETDGLLDHLDVMVGKEATDNSRQNVTEVHERLLDIRSLLANLVQQSAESTEKHTEKGTEKSTGKRAEENISQGGTDAQRNLRILVVDDGPVNLMLARQMLETQGLQVEGVSSGEQALERQQGALFDLVFMDIFMPTLDGLETTRRWREYERHQGGSQSVLVALTANADDARLDACLAAGMDDLLAKPYQPETLLNIITRWFPGTAKALPPA